jgi:hypothetical protein
VFIDFAEGEQNGNIPQDANPWGHWGLWQEQGAWSKGTWWAYFWELMHNYNILLVIQNNSDSFKIIPM